MGAQNGKLIDDCGRIVLPPEICRVIGIGGNDRIEIWVNSNNQIIIQKHMFACVFCDSSVNLKQYMGQFFCNNCQKIILEI